MLEKNKDYVEFTLHRTSIECVRKDKDYKEVCFNGYSDSNFPSVPMEVVCKEFDHKVVMISKRYFDRLQAENEQLKKKLEEFSPDLPGYREFLTALCPEADVEKMVWATRHIFGCRSQQDVLQSDLEYYRAMSSAQAKSVYNWKEATGCSTPEEAKELIDGKKRRIIELNDELDDSLSANKELIEKRETLEKEIEVYSRTLKEWKEITGCPSPFAAKTLIENGPTHIIYLNDPLDVIAKWEKVTGYDRPKDFLKWKANIEGIMEAWKDQTGCKYPGEARELLEKWKLMTKCETPEAAATWITSYESACGRGNRLAEMVEKLKEEVVSWKNVTGFSTPEKCSSYIDTLEKKLEDIKDLIGED